MKGLLLKDAYQMWSYTRWIILNTLPVIKGLVNSLIISS